MEMGAKYTKQCKVHGKVGECTQKEEREKGVHGSVGRAPKKRDLERECEPNVQPQAMFPPRNPIQSVQAMWR